MLTGLPARRRDRGRGDGRHDLVDVGRSRCPRSPTAARRPASGCTSTPPTRARRRSARSCAGASTAATAPTRSSSTRTSGCSRRSTARRSGRAGPRRCTRRSRRTATTSRSSEDALDLRDYGPALGRRFRALKLWTVLRCYGRDGPAGADPRARPARGALRGVGARRARLGGRGAAALLHRLLPAPDAPTTTSSRGARPRPASSSSRRRRCAARA